MRLSPRLSLFLTLAWTLVLLGGWALLSEMTSEAAPLAYDPNLEFEDPVHIPVGDDPRGIAVVGDKVYVANHDDDSISVIDGDTLTVTEEITANISSPCSMAYNPNNGYLYVTNRETSGTVTVISTTTNMTVTVLGIGDRPTGIVYNPKDGYIYVANFGDDDISVISGTVRINVFSAGFARSPAHLAVNPVNGKVYVTLYDDTNNGVAIINSTSVLTDISNVPQRPWGIAVNPNTGWVYVATVDGGELVRIRPDNDEVEDSINPSLPSPTHTLRMVAVDAAQNLVFVPQDDVTGGTPPGDGDPGPELEKVFVYDPETSDWVGEFEITVQQDPERGIAFDPVRHRLYVSNRRSNTVTVIQTIRELYFPIIMKSFS
jgi:YVTN family beta-propeller protein